MKKTQKKLKKFQKKVKKSKNGPPKNSIKWRILYSLPKNKVNINKDKNWKFGNKVFNFKDNVDFIKVFGFNFVNNFYYVSVNRGVFGGDWKIGVLVNKEVDLYKKGSKFAADEANRLRFVPYSQPSSILYLKLHRTAYWSPITLRFLWGLITSSERNIIFPPAPTL